MKITWHNSAYTILACVHPCPDLWTGTITVSRDRALFDLSWEPVWINWPTIGVQSVQDTEAFVLALQEAVRIGKAMMEPVHYYTVIYTPAEGPPMSHRIAGNNKAQVEATYEQAALKGGTLTIGEAVL